MVAHGEEFVRRIESLVAAHGEEFAPSYVSPFPLASASGSEPLKMAHGEELVLFVNVGRLLSSQGSPRSNS